MAAKDDTAALGEEPARHAATRLIAGLLPVARSHEAKIIADSNRGGGPEALHRYRVALRRIRSILSLFRGVYDPQVTADLKARFSALMAPTGALRDLDVYLLEEDAFKAQAGKAHRPGLDRIFALIRDKRAAEQAQVAAHLQTAGYEAEIAALTGLFAGDGPAAGPRAQRDSAHYARALIWKRYLRITAEAADLTPDTADDEIHELRIDCKKLRYLIEFFEPLFEADRLREVLKPLKELQDVLGLWHDLTVQQVRLGDLAHELEAGTGGAAASESAAALIKVLHRREREERGKIIAAFADFDSPEVASRFRALFHDGA